MNLRDTELNGQIQDFIQRGGAVETFPAAESTVEDTIKAFSQGEARCAEGCSVFSDVGALRLYCRVKAAGRLEIHEIARKEDKLFVIHDAPGVMTERFIRLLLKYVDVDDVRTTSAAA